MQVIRQMLRQFFYEPVQYIQPVGHVVCLHVVSQCVRLLLDSSHHEDIVIAA